MSQDGYRTLTARVEPLRQDLGGPVDGERNMDFPVCTRAGQIQGQNLEAILQPPCQALEPMGAATHSMQA
jgi:hypothetical protein